MLNLAASNQLIWAAGAIAATTSFSPRNKALENAG
jgi:hypothetical protein